MKTKIEHKNQNFKKIKNQVHKKPQLSKNPIHQIKVHTI